MWNLATLHDINDKATAAAKRKGYKQPKMVTAKQIEEMPPFPFPNFGDYEPDGWTERGRWQCDKTGMDDQGPALSIEGLKRRLLKHIKEHPRDGFAIVEEGQFQLYVGAFMPAEEARERKN